MICSGRDFYRTVLGFARVASDDGAVSEPVRWRVRAIGVFPDVVSVVPR